MRGTRGNKTSPGKRQARLSSQKPSSTKYNFTLVDISAAWTRNRESCRSLPYRSYVALAGHKRSQHAGPPSRSPANYIGGRTLVSPNWSLRKVWARHGLQESANRIWET
jgi:hypothetical protein